MPLMAWAPQAGTYLGQSLKIWRPWAVAQGPGQLPLWMHQHWRATAHVSCIITAAQVVVFNAHKPDLGQRRGIYVSRLPRPLTNPSAHPWKPQIRTTPNRPSWSRRLLHRPTPLPSPSSWQTPSSLKSYRRLRPTSQTPKLPERGAQVGSRQRIRHVARKHRLPQSTCDKRASPIPPKAPNPLKPAKDSDSAAIDITVDQSLVMDDIDMQSDGEDIDAQGDPDEQTAPHDPRFHHSACLANAFQHR